MTGERERERERECVCVYVAREVDGYEQRIDMVALMRSRKADFEPNARGGLTRPRPKSLAGP
jgi:hypothetical protein